MNNQINWIFVILGLFASFLKERPLHKKSIKYEGVFIEEKQDELESWAEEEYANVSGG